MKRFLILCLALVLVLCSCSPASDTPTADTKEQPSLPSTAPQPTEPVSPTSENTELQVVTDYSKYAPKQPEVSLYTRKSEQWIDNLEASDDYGAIYPFAGAAVYSYFMYDGLVGYQYGLIDETGCIIADPVYVTVKLAQGATWTDQFPMWVLEQAGLENEYGYRESLYALASLDGSFVTECKYIKILADAEQIVAVEKKNGRARFDVFDYDGDLLTVSENIRTLDGVDMTDAEMYFENGLLQIRTWPGSDPSSYFTDLVGTALVGPYGSGAFICSACIQVEESDAYILLNSAGNRVSDLFFEFLYDTGYSYISSRTTDGRAVLMDQYGEVLLEREGSGQFNCDAGGIYYVEGQEHIYYDSDGNVLYSETTSNTWSSLGGSYFQKGSKIINLATGEESESYLNPTIWGEFFGEQPYFVVREYIGGEYTGHLLNGELEEFVKERALGANGTAGISRDMIGGQPYPYMYDERYLEFYGASMTEPMLRIPTASLGLVKVYDGRVLFANETVCAYYDLNGELLFSFPLTSMGED